jgi:hypothetical protein
LVLDCDDRRRALRHFGPAHAEVVAEALGRHELVVAAHLDDATVGDGHDDGERSWANPAPMHIPNKANDYYRAARRSTRRR